MYLRHKKIHSALTASLRAALIGACWFLALGTCSQAYSQVVGDAPLQPDQPAAARPVEAEDKGDKLVEQYRALGEQATKLTALAREAESSVLGSELVTQYIAGEQVVLLDSQIDFIKACIKQAQEEHSCHQQSLAILKDLPAQLSDTYQSARHIQLPPADSSTADQALAYARIFEQLEQLDRQDALFIESLNIADQLNALDPQYASLLKNAISRRAASTVVLLKRTLQDVRGLKEASGLMPDDADLKARLTVTERRARQLGAALERVSSLLHQLGVDTSEYQELALAATGQLSAEALSSGVVSQLVAGWTKQLTKLAIDEGPGLVMKLIVFVVIFLISWRLARLLQSLVARGLDRSTRPVSQLLHRMIVNTVGNLVILVGGLIALSQLGISLGPVLAGVGVAGFVVGFALQDSLSNFASGIMILMYSPFDVGDVIETSGVFGKVSHMSLVNTTILTLDNQTIVVPNNKIWGEVIKNLTHQRERRVDMVFGIAYDADYDMAERILNEILVEDERILDDPEPVVRMHELADSSVNFVVRPWVKTEDYWDVHWHTTREVKKRFDAAGIGIPFPQRDVHLDTSQPLTIQLQRS